jgi:ABC-type uncharacterized transport system YnjBCD substrate-binding protein
MKKELIDALAKHLPGWRITATETCYNESTHPYQIQIGISRDCCLATNMHTSENPPTWQDWCNIIAKLPIYYAEKKNFAFITTDAPSEFTQGIESFIKEQENACH